MDDEKPMAEDYEMLHATVVDAIRYLPTTKNTDDAAHEALQRLRDIGVPIPPRPDR